MVFQDEGDVGRIQPKDRFESKAYHSSPAVVQGRGYSPRTDLSLKSSSFKSSKGAGSRIQAKDRFESKALRDVSFEKACMSSEIFLKVEALRSCSVSSIFAL